MVYKRSKVVRMSFRKLPFGGVCNFASATGRPAIKTGRRNILSFASDAGLTLETVGDTSVRVAVVPPNLYLKTPPYDTL